MGWDRSDSKLILGRFFIEWKLMERWILLIEEFGCKLYRSSLNG